jgi:tetratricopeptide (TPR) repeat protein
MDVPEESQAQKYLNSGQQCLEFGNYSIALHYFEQAIATNPNSVEAWDEKAATLRKLGRYEEAIATSEKAILLRVNVVETKAHFWLSKSKLQVSRGDLKEAITRACFKIITTE